MNANNLHNVVPRVDPRRPAVITPAGLRRIVLGSSEGDRLAVRQSHGPITRPQRSAGPFSRTLLVATHAERGALNDAARQAVAAAAILASPDTEVIVAVLGPCRDDVAALGADRVLLAGDFDPARYQPTASVRWLQALHAAYSPLHWLFADGGADGALGRRFAVQAGLLLAANVVELNAGTLRTPASLQQDWLEPHAPVMLLGKGVASARLPFTGLGVVEAAKAVPPFPQFDEAQIEDLGVSPGDPQTLALEEADFIMAAGNGVTDLPLFRSLAQEVGAAVGASRVAVDDGRFARAQQIGATGKTVFASAYMAMGISGAVQHLQGIKDCRHVIAVNVDASAPIARRANLTVVEDSGALMQALLALVRHEKEKT